jgi:hypothetical protein
MNYKFLRAREEFQRDLMFRSLERIGAVDLGKYEVVYDGELEAAGHEDWKVCEELFRIFNIDHPADFRAASMSVGDIVMLDRSRLFFCDTAGFVALTGEHAPVAYSRVELYAASRPARATASRRTGR